MYQILIQRKGWGKEKRRKIGKGRKSLWNGYVRNNSVSQAQWLKPIILATCKVEMERIMIQGQPRQKVYETPISING
jgi:hypothetical protein